MPIDSPIKSVKDLGVGGATAVSFIHDLGQLAVYKEIDESGGDWKSSKLQFVELPMSASFAAVEANRVVAGEASYPPAQAAIDSGKVRLIPAYNTFGKEFIFSVWFTTKDYATKHPDVVKTFARVVATAAKYTNSHPKETADVSGVLRHPTSNDRPDAARHQRHIGIRSGDSAADQHHGEVQLHRPLVPGDGDHRPGYSREINALNSPAIVRNTGVQSSATVWRMIRTLSYHGVSVPSMRQR